MGPIAIELLHHKCVCALAMRNLMPTQNPEIVEEIVDAGTNGWVGGQVSR